VWHSILDWVVFVLFLAFPVRLGVRWLWRAFFPRPRPTPKLTNPFQPTARINGGPPIPIQSWTATPSEEDLQSSLSADFANAIEPCEIVIPAEDIQWFVTPEEFAALLKGQAASVKFNAEGGWRP
jgi:hypothetical protein